MFARFGLFVSALAGNLCLAVPAQAAIQILVSYTFVEVEVAPVPSVHRSRSSSSFVMQGKQYVVSNNGVSAGGVGTIGRENRRVNSFGMTYGSRVSVVGSNTLRTTSSYPTYTITTTIRTNGSDSCVADRTARLKPGHRYFEDTRRSNGDHMFISDLHFEDVGCQIRTR